MRHSETRNEALVSQSRSGKNPVARGVNKVNAVSRGSLRYLPATCLRRWETGAQDDIKFPPYSLIVQNLLYPIVAAISLKWYNQGKVGKCIMYAAKKLKLIPLILTKEEKNGVISVCKKNIRMSRPALREGRDSCGFAQQITYKMPNVLAYLFLRQFKKLDEYNKHRCEIANFYNNALRGTEFKLPSVWDESEPIYLRYTVFTEDAAKIMKAARKKDIYLGDWYRNVIAPSDVNLEGVGYEQFMCSKAEEYSAMSVNLPNHFGIGMDEAEKVAKEIKK